MNKHYSAYNNEVYIMFLYLCVYICMAMHVCMYHFIGIVFLHEVSHHGQYNILDSLCKSVYIS